MFSDYISYLQEKGMAQNTIISYTNDLNSFFNEMNIEPDDYVTAADIRKWIDAMLNPTEGKATGRYQLLIDVSIRYEAITLGLQKIIRYSTNPM